MQKEDYEDLYNLEEELWWFAGMREITAAILDSQPVSTKNKFVLDAGCGTGGMLSWLERYARGGHVVGIDLIKDALDFDRKRNHKNIAQASVTHLPFADSIFDLVTSFDVLVQLPGKRADEIAIREMFRVLRPGGIAFVRVAAYHWMRSGHDKALGSTRRYTVDELSEKMKSAGFQIQRVTYANSFLLPIAIIRRLLLKRIKFVDDGSDVKPLPVKIQFLNKTFINILKKEAEILRNPKARLPAGLSAICLAVKSKN